jgi:hypothetical protein
MWHFLGDFCRQLVLVDDAAVPPDLAVGAVLDVDGGHLQHRPGELLPPPPASSFGVVAHHRRRLLRCHERRVGDEEHVAVQHVLVVHWLSSRSGMTMSCTTVGSLLKVGLARHCPAARRRGPGSCRRAACRCGRRRTSSGSGRRCARRRARRGRRR